MTKFRSSRSAAFTRPANTTAYASGDIVANHATAGNVVVPVIDAARFPGGNGTVTAIQLQKSGVDLTNAQFRVHLFTAAPTVGGGDNAAFAVTNGGTKGYLGHVDVTVDQALGDAAHGRAGCSIQFDTTVPSGKLYALVEARGAYTPVSGETFTLKFELERD